MSPSFQGPHPNLEFNWWSVQYHLDCSWWCWGAGCVGVAFLSCLYDSIIPLWTSRSVIWMSTIFCNSSTGQMLDKFDVASQSTLLRWFPTQILIKRQIPGCSYRYWSDINSKYVHCLDDDLTTSEYDLIWSGGLVSDRPHLCPPVVYPCWAFQ